MAQTIFTVGHSSLNFMQFITLIQANNINHIVDIRSIPYSKYAPWSDKSRLPNMLLPFKIKYTYLGHKLGGKPIKKTRSPEQRNLPPQAVYNEAIKVLMELSMRSHLAIMCAEGDPGRCHRQHTIAQTLLASGTKVLHILNDGTIKEAWIEEKAPDQPRLF
ncbi:MAG: hypothetical protein BWX85_01449 [Chloroflexi bacterium ADurb.Bin120]|jgi:uncharacterized protein (DUF488 family)|uniref:DUF488 domain-containing protein n=2 Tax=Candidatus Brevifilum fermentans TaxID=1986204 RepID=A0A1Y6K7Q6_9CHLR|nr:MAG: hypothetical protein BWX85_01449 [Chloroflexi bacterium ADurb.Bin120]SMX54867.1 conserved protein of unknown function [Brevefilum fermentans]